MFCLVIRSIVCVKKIAPIEQFFLYFSKYDVNYENPNSSYNSTINIHFQSLKFIISSPINKIIN